MEEAAEEKRKQRRIRIVGNTAAEASAAKEETIRRGGSEEEAKRKPRKKLSWMRRCEDEMRIHADASTQRQCRRMESSKDAIAKETGEEMKTAACGGMRKQHYIHFSSNARNQRQRTG